MFTLRGSRRPKIDFRLMYIYQMFKTWQTGRRLIAPALLIARRQEISDSPTCFLQGGKKTALNFSIDMQGRETQCEHV